MKPRGAVRFVGLTGSIATGKSTAARYFAEEGALVIDADQVARAVVEPGRPALEEIREAFGDHLHRTDGTLDREALAAVVFRDPAARARLNRIVHPRVEAEVQAVLQRAWQEDPGRIVVYDVPLLYEVGIEGSFDRVVVVHVPPEGQRKRLIDRDGLAPEDADARIASQTGIDEKARKADVVLDNSGSPEDLRRQVRGFLAEIRRENLELNENSG